MVDSVSLSGKNSSSPSCHRALKSLIKRWLRRQKSSRSTHDNPRRRSQQQHQQEEHDEDETEGGGTTMRRTHSHHSNDDSNNTNGMRRFGRDRTRSFDNNSWWLGGEWDEREEKKKGRKKRNGSCDWENRAKGDPLGVASRVMNTGGIMYSTSSGVLKPPPIEMNLECTLEDLCYGCVKKFKITRDVFSDTMELVQEEETVTVNVEPGWKTGTKITFQGKGSDRPGMFREDIVFLITEKIHQLFIREGDDLELGVEIPLVKALTGCTIQVPLLGGEEMNLDMEQDIIYPGYQRLIDGQGMPISKEPGMRGNLRITFLVEFPKELTDSHRSEVVNILLQGSS